MNVFYFNLNAVHEAAEKTIKDYNKDLITNFQRTIDSPEVDAHWPLMQFNNYHTYMSTNETARPLFDYYLKHREFNIREINKLYSGIDVNINEERLTRILKQIDKNVELIKQSKPDIVMMRLYGYYEFLILYFLDQIKDVDCYTILGGGDFGFDNWYYVDQLLDQGLLDNFHDGYGEKHLGKVIQGLREKKTVDFCYTPDDYTVPTSDTHFIINTLKCNGTCSFCVHNRAARKFISAETVFTSDDYIDFVTDRIKYFESCGVDKCFVPASITFYNTEHLKRFHEAYMRKGLSVNFVDTYFKFEDITEETLPLMQEMNFHSIKLGLESIKKDVRLRVGKTYETDHVYSVTQMLKESSIYFKYSFIFNFPFTTQDDLMEDYKFIKEFDLRYFAWNRYELYTDTDLNNFPEKNNLRREVNEHGYEYFERLDKSGFKSNVFKVIEEHLAQLHHSNLALKKVYQKGYVEYWKNK